MREFYLPNGEKRHITEHDWHKLVKRFSAKPELEGDFWYTIDLPCALCEHFRAQGQCFNCPMIYSEPPYGPYDPCWWIFLKLRKPRTIEVGSSSGIGWPKSDNRVALAFLKRVQKWLMGMEKVGERKL